MKGRVETGARVEALRRAFDDAFAAPPTATAAGRIRLLAIRVGSEPFAIPVLDTAGLMQPKRIVPIPSRRGELVGLAGVRGTLVPVYSLAALVGCAPTDDDPRWIVLFGAEEKIALAFSAFEGHFEVPSADVHPARSLDSARGHVDRLAQVDGRARPIISIASISRAITNVP